MTAADRLRAHADTPRGKRILARLQRRHVRYLVLQDDGSHHPDGYLPLHRALRLAEQLEPLKVLNLGAGVQSSTMALLAAEGKDLEQPDLAIFADTGWEPKGVYVWLSYLEQHLPFPVIRASNGNLRERLLQIPKDQQYLLSAPSGARRLDEERRREVVRRSRFAAVPFFTKGGGMGRRQCTKEYKIMPIRHAIKRHLGIGPGKRARLLPGSVQCWIGISVDEAIRMKDSDVEWVQNRYPLVELNMNRHDCIAWLMRHGHPKPPKSSCLGCPYHGDDYWMRMRRETPDEWADTVELDKAIRNMGTVGMKEQQFMHRSLVPLDQVEFADDHGQGDLFGEECTGHCGT